MSFHPAENRLFDKTFENKAHNQHLSIQLSNTLLKLAWFDIPSKKYIGLQQIDLNNAFDWQVLFSNLFPEGKDFQSVSLSIINGHYTLVPKGIFDEKALSSYLQFNLGAIAGKSDSNLVDSIGAHLVYTDNNRYSQEIQDSLPGIKTSHFGKSLLEAFSQENIEKGLMVHVQEGRFDIACLQNKKLTFFNSFEYKTAEDFIYFLLYVMEQLKLDKESFPLFLCGEITEQSAIYELVYKYIRNVSLLQRPKSANYSTILNEIPSSFHYSLFNQYLCE